VNLFHILFEQDDSFFAFPQEIYYGYIVRRGKMKIKNERDFKYISKVRTLYSRSYTEEGDSLLRKLRVTSMDNGNNVLFFQYEEPIPYEVVNVYRHKIISGIENVISVTDLIMQLNGFLKKASEEFSYEYMKWLDEIFDADEIEDDDLMEDNTQKNETQLRGYLNLFSNSYITDIFGKVYDKNISLLLGDQSKIIYKIYEMKYLNDKDMVSRI